MLSVFAHAAVHDVGPQQVLGASRHLFSLVHQAAPAVGVQQRHAGLERDPRALGFGGYVEDGVAADERLALQRASPPAVLR